MGAVSQRSLAPVARRTAVALGAGALLVLALEGGARLLLARLGEDAAGGAAPLAERSHTRFDPELGWVNVPSLRVPDLYGPGRSLSTNARGFRGLFEVADEAPEGTLRVVCAGDSFTLGYGVDDEETWVHLLGAGDEGIETVNMGQGGYGVDQAYLWYRRDGEALEHHVLLLAFITLDFERMRKDSFRGFQKPRLALPEDPAGEPFVRNAPLSRPSWLARRRMELESLGLVRLARAMRSRGGSGAQTPVPGADAGGARRGSAGAGGDGPIELAERIFRVLRDRGAERGVTLLLVYLPLHEDLAAEPPLTAAWRQVVATLSTRLGVPLVDVVAELQGLPGDELRRLYLAPDEVDHPGAAGHFSAEGNARVAAILRERIRELAASRSPEDGGGEDG